MSDAQVEKSEFQGSVDSQLAFSIPSSCRGFSLLDLLIVLLVLTVVLLAAVNQFGAYQQPSGQPAPQAEPAPAPPTQP